MKSGETEDWRPETGDKGLMRDNTKILAWQKADDLTVAVYEATDRGR